MGGMRRQHQTLQWHDCNEADWSPIWPPAGPAGFSIHRTPNPPSLRHHRHRHPIWADQPSPIDFNLATVLTLAAGFTSTPLPLLARTASECFHRTCTVAVRLPSLMKWQFLIPPFLCCSRIKKLPFSIWIKGHNQSMITFADLSPFPLCVIQGHNPNLSWVLKVIKLWGLEQAVKGRFYIEAKWQKCLHFYNIPYIKYPMLK